MKHFFTKLTLLTLSVGLLTSCDKNAEDRTKTVTDLVVEDPNFSILEAAVVKAGLADALATTQNLTVFAPDNAAFAAAGINEATINSLSPAALTSILTYHVLPVEVRSGQIQDGRSSATTLANSAIYLSKQNIDNIFVNGNSRVSKANIPVTNGTIHVINNVIMPPAGNIVDIAVANPNFSLLVKAVTKTGLAGALTGTNALTVFAPVNSAFEAIGFNAAAIDNATGATVETLRKVLLYHVVAGRYYSPDLVGLNTVPTVLEGGKVIINEGATVKGSGNNVVSKIIIGNVTATNGAIHAIDRVLLP